MILVKRYKNRKLYNTSTKRYITLLGISHLINDGEQVKIIDNDTGDDLTALTLAQIIFVQQKSHRESLPLLILSSLIERNWTRLLDWLLSSSFETFPLKWVKPEDFESTLVKLDLPSRAEFLHLSSQIEELEKKLEGLSKTDLQKKAL